MTTLGSVHSGESDGGRLGERDVEQRRQIGARREHARELGLDDLRAAAAVDERRAVAQALEQRGAQRAPSSTADRARGCSRRTIASKSSSSATFSTPSSRARSAVRNGSLASTRKPNAVQVRREAARDPPHADEADRLARGARAVERLGRREVVRRRVLAHGAEVAAARQQDLRQHELGRGDRVDGPRRDEHDAALDERRRERLDVARGVEHGRELRHAPRSGPR